MREIKVVINDTLDYDVKFKPSEYANEKEVAVYVVTAGAMLCKETMDKETLQELRNALNDVFEEE